MRDRFKFLSLSIVTFIIVVFLKCGNKPPFIPDYKNVKGYVIAKEYCNSDSTKDYWLIDLTYLSNTPQYGDTLVLNNIAYTNVVKTKELSDQLKQIGMRVSIDFKVLSTNRVITTDCTINSPITYPLKELFIINQGEIR